MGDSPHPVKVSGSHEAGARTPASVPTEWGGIMNRAMFVRTQLWTQNSERAGGVWQHRKQTRLTREIAGWSARRDKLPTFQLAHVAVQPVTMARSVRADVGAHWPVVKAVIDGLVDVGVLADDDPTHVPAILQLPPRSPDPQTPAESGSGLWIGLSDEGLPAAWEALGSDVPVGATA